MSRGSLAENRSNDDPESTLPAGSALGPNRAMLGQGDKDFCSSSSSDKVPGAAVMADLIRCDPRALLPAFDRVCAEPCAFWT